VTAFPIDLDRDEMAEPASPVSSKLETYA